MAPPAEHRQKGVIAVNLWTPTNGDHLHVSAMEIALQLVYILGDDGLVGTVELTSTTVVVEGARTPTADVLFYVHVELGW